MVVLRGVARGLGVLTRAVLAVVAILVRLPNSERKELILRLAGQSGESDYLNKYRAVEILAQCLDRRIVLSEPNRTFLEDEDFRARYDAVVGSGNPRSLDRKFQLLELLRAIKDVPGDFAECGVYRGATASVLIETAARSDRRVHLFDSFQGLSSPSLFDGDHWQRGSLAATTDDVRNAIASLPDVWTIYEGWIPTRFAEVHDRRFAFVHVDVDLYEPTLASLRFFVPRLSFGGLLLLDDHGFSTCPGARLAAAEYASDYGCTLIELSSGQALLLPKGLGQCHS